MPATETLLETKNYSVVQQTVEVENKKREGYAVVNNKTGVIEYETTILVQALINAAQWDTMISREIWATYMNTDDEDPSEEEGSIIDIDPEPGEPVH